MDQADPQDDVIRHSNSGWAFPEQLGKFTRVSTRQYDDEGLNISVGYNSDSAALTLFVYPRPPSVTLESIMDGVTNEVRQAFMDIKVIADRAVGIRTSAGNRSGIMRKLEVQLQPERRKGTSGESPDGWVRSLTFLFEVGAWLLKARITIAHLPRYDVVESVEWFLGQMTWPGASME